MKPIFKSELPQDKKNLKLTMKAAKELQTLSKKSIRKQKLSFKKEKKQGLINKQAVFVPTISEAALEVNPETPDAWIGLLSLLAARVLH